MSAPDPKAVEAALHDLDAAHRCVGSHTLAPDTMRTLEAAARAYLRAPTAPDTKAVEAAIAEAETAVLDERRLTAGILITLIDAARAYLDTPKETP